MAPLLQLRVSRQTLALLYSRVDLCRRCGDDVSGHALDVGLRYLAGRLAEVCRELTSGAGLAVCAEQEPAPGPRLSGGWVVFP